MTNFVKKSASILFGILFVAGVILIFNVINPPVYMSDLTTGYWAGYYETNLFGKVWCLAKFYKEQRKPKMLLLTIGDTNDIYSVESNSSDEDFVHFAFKADDYEEEIKAKQLYSGKRYILERLLAGRFTDFWQKNSEDQIRGKFVSRTDNNKFEIERMPRERVVDFYNDFVLRENRYSNISEIDSLIKTFTSKK